MTAAGRHGAWFALAALLALAGCASASRGASSPASSSPSAQPAPAAPAWLVLKPGATMHLAPGGNDSHSLVSVSIRDLRKRYAVRVQPSDAKRTAGTTVTVARVGPALTDDPGSDTAVLVRSKDGWNGWVDGEEQLQPIVPRGTILGQSTPSTGDLVRYWPHQSDAFEDGIPLDRDVRFEFLAYVPNPGNAEYRVRIANGAHKGEIGFVMFDGLASGNGLPLKPALPASLSAPW